MFPPSLLISGTGGLIGSEVALFFAGHGFRVIYNRAGDGGSKVIQVVGDSSRQRSPSHRQSRSRNGLAR